MTPKMGVIRLSVGERDHVLGPPAAPLTLVEYGDFECPYCGQAHGVVKELVRRLGRQLRFVFRHFPLTMVHPHAQQAAVPTRPQHIEATQTFLMMWGNQRWEELRAVSGDKITVKVGPSAYTLEPGAQKSDVRLTLPFRGLSTVRTDGKITAVKVEELALKMGDTEMRGPGTVELADDNGVFRVTGVTANPQ